MGVLAASQSICDHDIIGERWRQVKKWGVQQHTDGTGGLEWQLAAREQRNRNDNTDPDAITWTDILIEEVWEALAESEPESLREELIQVAAVCVGWVEDLDRRQFARVKASLPELQLEGAGV